MHMRQMQLDRVSNVLQVLKVVGGLPSTASQIPAGGCKQPTWRWECSCAASARSCLARACRSSASAALASRSASAAASRKPRSCKALCSLLTAASCSPTCFGTCCHETQDADMVVALRWWAGCLAVLAKSKQVLTAACCVWRGVIATL